VSRLLASERKPFDGHRDGMAICIGTEFKSAQGRRRLGSVGMSGKRPLDATRSKPTNLSLDHQPLLLIQGDTQ
jgi:hypothetical protein